MKENELLQKGDYQPYKAKQAKKPKQKTKKERKRNARKNLDEMSENEMEQLLLGDDDELLDLDLDGLKINSPIKNEGAMEEEIPTTDYDDDNMALLKELEGETIKDEYEALADKKKTRLARLNQRVGETAQGEYTIQESVNSEQENEKNFENLSQSRKESDAKVEVKKETAAPSRGRKLKKLRKVKTHDNE